jgi:hypothetical protein
VSCIRPHLGFAPGVLFGAFTDERRVGLHWPNLNEPFTEVWLTAQWLSIAVVTPAMNDIRPPLHRRFAVGSLHVTAVGDLAQLRQYLLPRPGA